MEKPKVVKCPDGHFRRVIFSLGLYIADYLKQVWLAGIVSNWCLKYVYYVFLHHMHSTDMMLVDVMLCQQILMVKEATAVLMKRQTF